jgi:predicted transcriptional regulator
MDAEGWTEEQLNQRCSELIAEHIVGDLVKKDLVDYRIKEDGEIVYSVTPKGKEKILAELDLTSGDSTV